MTDNNGVEKTLEELGAFIKKERDIYSRVLKQAQANYNRQVPEIVNPEAVTLAEREQAEDALPSYVNLDQVIDPTYGILGHLGNETDVESKRTSLVQEKLENMFYLATFCVAIGDVEMAKDAATNYKEMKSEATGDDMTKLTGKIGVDGVQFMAYILDNERRINTCHQVIRTASKEYDKGNLGVAIQTRPEVDGGFAKQYMDKYKQGICMKMCQAKTAGPQHES